MACICYKTSSGRESHPISWQTLATYPGNESGFNAAIRHEAQLLETGLATRIIRCRDDDCRKVWLVQQCRPWKCCERENT